MEGATECAVTIRTRSTPCQTSFRSLYIAAGFVPKRKCRAIRTCGRRNCSGHQPLCCFFEEHQPAWHPIPVNRNRFSGRHLVCSQKVRERVNQMSLDRALQMPGSIFNVSSFPQQEILRRLRCAKHEMSSRCFCQSLLHHDELDV